MADEAAAASDIWVDSWFTIWYRPRATIRRIIDTDPRKFVLGIAFVAGAAQVMQSTVALPSNMPHLPHFGPLGIIVLALFYGLISIVGIYGLGALYRWSGGILGGTATRIEVRAAMAWSQVPALYLEAAIFIASALSLGAPLEQPSISPFSVVEFVIGFWVFVISLKCLGEVHHFSAWRALGAILLGGFAMIAVVLGIVLTIWLAVRLVM